MFETLESRRMMSVSTIGATQAPPPPTTTSSADVDESKGESQVLSMLQNAFNEALKSLAEAAAQAARSA